MSTARRRLGSPRGGLGDAPSDAPSRGDQHPPEETLPPRSTSSPTARAAGRRLRVEVTCGDAEAHDARPPWAVASRGLSEGWARGFRRLLGFS